MISGFSTKDVAVKNRIPLNVSIELLTSCNFKCKHCYIPQHDNIGLSFSTIESILHQLRDMGTFDIIFTGGEIFLRDDIVDIVSLARKLFFNVSLFTNISLLDEKKLWRFQSFMLITFLLQFFH